MAGQVPQIHIVSDKGVSRSAINSLINSCHEAREAVASLRLEYFLFGRHILRNYGIPTSGTNKNYFNAGLDTFWIVRNGEGTIRLPTDISSAASVTKNVQSTITIRFSLVGISAMSRLNYHVAVHISIVWLSISWTTPPLET